MRVASLATLTTPRASATRRMLLLGPRASLMSGSNMIARRAALATATRRAWPQHDSLAAGAGSRMSGGWGVVVRGCSTDSPTDSKPASSPKIDALVEQIASLSLLEASELTEALKTKLGISSAMMMPAAGGGGGGGGGSAAAPAEEAPEPVAEKTHFTIKLESFDAASKIKLIKEVRAITGLGLKEAKEVVEKAPSELKADVKKEEAESMKEKLEAVGGKVALE